MNTLMIWILFGQFISGSAAPEAPTQPTAYLAYNSRQECERAAATITARDVHVWCEKQLVHW